MKGLVHIYTGPGKGKTTAAVGLGVRACGRGFKVLMVQFIKSTDTGEMFSLKKLEPDFVLIRGTSSDKFTWKMSDEEKEITRNEQRKLLGYAEEAFKSGSWDMVILDEFIGAISSGMVDLQEAVRLVKGKPEKTELVMTGRNAPEALIDLADYVSEINAVKHPMQKGISARTGIED